MSELQQELPRAARRTFAERLIGAALLHVDVYEEVEADTRSNLEAAGVVALVATASVIGAGHADLASVVLAALSWITGVLLVAGVTYLIGDKLLRGTATWGELLRTIGFAQTPGLLLVLGVIPRVGLLVDAVVLVWMVFTTVIAIRQALDFGTGRAIVTALLGFGFFWGLQWLA